MVLALKGGIGDGKQYPSLPKHAGRRGIINLFENTVPGVILSAKGNFVPLLRICRFDGSL